MPNFKTNLQPRDISDKTLDAMLSAALSEIDYDIWKHFFAEPACGHAEDPKAAQRQLASARSAMRNAMDKNS